MRDIDNGLAGAPQLAGVQVVEEDRQDDGWEEPGDETQHADVHGVDEDAVDIPHVEQLTEVAQTDPVAAEHAFGELVVLERDHGLEHDRVVAVDQQIDQGDEQQHVDAGVLAQFCRGARAGAAAERCRGGDGRSSRALCAGARGATDHGLGISGTSFAILVL